jgi:hypothetical protein
MSWDLVSKWVLRSAPVLARPGPKFSSARWRLGRKIQSSRRPLPVLRQMVGRTRIVPRSPGQADSGSRRAGGNRSAPFERCFRPIRPHLLRKIGLLRSWLAVRGLLHSRPAFGIALPLPASDRRHLGCGCSSVVEHDLAKVGVEGSSPFARSNFLPKSPISGGFGPSG